MLEHNKAFKKSIYLVIDAMRFDAIKDDLKLAKLYPTLTQLAKKGIFKKVVTNAQSTQFVLPSMFSLTYPLDNGGYNYGIRNRKSSYVESIKKILKRETIMFSTCNQMGIGTSYDRGFDEIYTTFDLRILIEQKINRTLLYEIDLYKKKKTSKKELIRIIQKEFGTTLDLLKVYYDKYNKEFWPKKLHKINQFVRNQCIEEKKILMQTPDITLKKLQEISGGVYWHTLGKKKYKTLDFFIERIKTAAAWRTMKIIGKQNIWPFFILSHYQVLFNELIDGLCKKLTKIKNDEWHIHMHIMDLHDCRSINRLLHLIGRYKYFPKWFFQKIKGNTKHRFVYASSLMHIDSCLQKLIFHLKKEGIFNETLILITADHGSNYAESPRKTLQVADRTHYEHIEVPLILSKKIEKNVKRNVCDSMGVTATFLDVLKIPLDNSYKGESIFKKGKDFIITENAGSGNADVIRKDLYFTITTIKYKLMVCLLGKKLKINKLYNIQKDPYELNNLYDSNKKLNESTIIKSLLKKLFLERKDIFKLRGIKKLEQCK